MLFLAGNCVPGTVHAQTNQFPPNCSPSGTDVCASPYGGSWGYQNRGSCANGSIRATEAAAVQDIYTDYTRPTNCSLSVTPGGDWYHTGQIFIPICGSGIWYSSLPVIDAVTNIEIQNYRPYTVDYTYATTFVPPCSSRSVETGHPVGKGREILCPLGMSNFWYGTVMVNGVAYTGRYCKATGAVPAKNLGSCSSSSSAGGSAGNGGQQANPITLGVGNKLQVETDYAGGGSGIHFERTYNSGGVVQSQSSANFGSNWFTQMGAYWRHTYDRTLAVNATPLITTVQAYRPDGRVLGFNLYNSVYSADPDISDRLAVLSGGAGWKYTTAEDEVEIYNSAGQLQSITSRSGVVQTMTYSTSTTPPSVAPVPGLLIGVTDSFGRKLSFTYDSASRIVSMTDPANKTYTYAYGANNNLTGVTYPDSRTRTYVYDEAAFVSGVDEPNALTGIIDENSVRFATFQYDASGRAIFSGHGTADNYTLVHNADGTVTSTDPLGKVRTYGFATLLGVRKVTSISAACSSCGGTSASTTYDANGNATSKTDFNGNVTQYSFDPTRNLETSRTEAYGTPRARTITTSWHPVFRLPATITETNRTTSFTFDGSGNVLTKTITDTATGGTRTWTYTYNGYGQVLSADGPRSDVSDVTTYTYYSCTTGYQCGQINTITNAANQTTTYNTYNAHGQPLTITDPNGVVTTLTYDARQRLTSRQVGSETSSFSYWPTGLLKQVTLPDGSYVQYTYDAAHRLTDLTDGAGNKIHYTLDAMGNRTAENSYDPSNALHRTHSRVYNNLNQLYQDINAAGGASVTTTFGYDSQGNQTSISAPLSRNTSNAYDELNRLKQITDPGGGITQFQFDAIDNLISVTDPRSLITSYQYNGFGDLKQQSSPDSGTTTNTFDSGGNLKTSTDARGALATYSYDALNRVTQVAYTDQTISFGYDAGTNGKGRLTSASDDNHALSWSYDAQGRVTGKGQTVGGITRSIGYGYANGNQVTISLPSGQLVTYQYNANHQITGITLGTGTPITILSNITYEPFGPVKSWTWGNATIMNRSFDADGRITAMASGGVLSFNPITYDNASRITGITDTLTSANSWSYGYDAMDRVSSAAKSGTSYGWTYDLNGNRKTQTGTSATTYTIASTSNRLTNLSGATTRTYGFDASGNVTSYDTWSLTYNKRNRMSGAVSGASNTSYVYNALGQMIKKIGAVNALMMYDEAGHLVGEYTSSGALTQETIWLGDIPVATIRPNGSTYDIFYVHTDQLNAPRVISRPSDNKQRWRWDPSGPFGGGAANENPASLGAFSFNLRFPGQIAMSETGNRQNGFRDYESFTGRYLQSDPIGLKGGINSYSYVTANPLGRIDSLGLYGYGDIMTFWNHYCDGTGEVTATGFTSINWGDTPSLALSRIQALVGASCSERSIPVNFNINAKTGGADAYIIGRHVVKTSGTINVHCNCTWSLDGSLSSALGYDPYDFDASNRGFVGETLTWLGAHRCPNTGTPFRIYITGKESLSSSGTIAGGSPTCCH